MKLNPINGGHFGNTEIGTSRVFGAARSFRSGSASGISKSTLTRRFTSKVSTNSNDSTRRYSQHVRSANWGAVSLPTSIQNAESVDWGTMTSVSTSTLVSSRLPSTTQTVPLALPEWVLTPRPSVTAPAYLRRCCDSKQGPQGERSLVRQCGFVRLAIRRCGHDLLGRAARGRGARCQPGDLHVAAYRRAGQEARAD